MLVAALAGRQKKSAPMASMLRVKAELTKGAMISATSENPRTMPYHPVAPSLTVLVMVSRFTRMMNLAATLKLLPIVS